LAERWSKARRRALLASSQAEATASSGSGKSAEGPSPSVFTSRSAWRTLASRDTASA